MKKSDPESDNILYLWLLLIEYSKTLLIYFIRYLRESFHGVYIIHTLFIIDNKINTNRKTHGRLMIIITHK